MPKAPPQVAGEREDYSDDGSTGEQQRHQDVQDVLNSEGGLVAMKAELHREFEERINHYMVSMLRCCII